MTDRLVRITAALAVATLLAEDTASEAPGGRRGRVHPPSCRAYPQDPRRAPARSLPN